MASRYKLGLVIAHEEGFDKPGTLPSRRHNPGDLRHSPHSEHPGGPAHANDVGTIDTDEHGWQDLDRQLEIYAREKLTLRSMIALYAPPTDDNDTSRYLRDVCAAMGMSPDTPVSDALKVAA
jgi:hypothetical protein